VHLIVKKDKFSLELLHDLQFSSFYKNGHPLDLSRKLRRRLLAELLSFFKGMDFGLREVASDLMRPRRRKSEWSRDFALLPWKNQEALPVSQEFSVGCFLLQVRTDLV